MPHRGVRSRYSGLRVQGTASSPPSTTVTMVTDDPPKVKWRRGWDSNPRSIAAYAISNRAESATLAPLRNVKGIIAYNPFSHKRAGSEERIPDSGRSARPARRSIAALLRSAR